MENMHADFRVERGKEVYRVLKNETCILNIQPCRIDNLAC